MPFGCEKHLEHIITHARTYSNIGQAKVRGINPEYELQYCEVCKEIACYHAVPIKFEE
jgi:hypothetical protein